MEVEWCKEIKVEVYKEREKIVVAKMWKLSVGRRYK